MTHRFLSLVSFSFLLLASTLILVGSESSPKNGRGDPHEAIVSLWSRQNHSPSLPRQERQAPQRVLFSRMSLPRLQIGNEVSSSIPVRSPFLCFDETLMGLSLSVNGTLGRVGRADYSQFRAWRARYTNKSWAGKNRVSHQRSAV